MNRHRNWTLAAPLARMRPGKPCPGVLGRTCLTWIVRGDLCQFCARSLALVSKAAA